MRNLIARAALSLLLCAASAAGAHARLDRAEPRVGSAVATAPQEVSLRFTQKVEAAFSRIEVRDSQGTRVDQGPIRPDNSDPTVLRVGLKPLPAGTYKVHWRVLSSDTHVTEGHFSFQVGR